MKINVVIISLLLIAGGMVNGQGRGRNINPGDYCSNVPGITEKQKQELADLGTRHRAEMDKLRAERQDADTYEKFAAAGEKMRTATEKHRFERMNIFTPEQRESLRSNNGGRGQGMAKGKMRGHGNRGRGNGNGYPGMACRR